MSTKSLAERLLIKPQTSVWTSHPEHLDSVWPILAKYGLRPIGQLSLSDVWSAMRFRPLKPGEAPPGGRQS